MGIAGDQIQVKENLSKIFFGLTWLRVRQEQEKESKGKNSSLG